MAVFSTNQVRNLYVVTNVKAAGTQIVESDPIGTISFFNTSESAGKLDGYALYKGVDGITKTDIVFKTPNTVTDARAVSYLNQRRPLRRTNVTLNSAINGGAPVAGQEYIIRIVIKEAIGLSPEYQEWKYGAVFAIPGMSATLFATEMAASLNKTFNRDDPRQLQATTSGANIIIEELSQPWQLGLKENLPVNFEVQVMEVTVNGYTTTSWATITQLTPTNYVNNGQRIAEMEYFYLGERGDVYRYNGYPYVFHATYLVDPTNQYDVVEVHFFWSGQNHAVQRSDKQLTFVFPVGTTPSHDLANAAITAINAQWGLEIESLT